MAFSWAQSQENQFTELSNSLTAPATGDIPSKKHSKLLRSHFSTQNLWGAITPISTVLNRHFQTPEAYVGPKIRRMRSTRWTTRTVLGAARKNSRKRRRAV